MAILKEMPTVKTKILIRVDVDANWRNNNPVLLNKEIAASVTPADLAKHTPRQVKIYIGDGVTAFNDLQEISAKASDVQDWAKGSIQEAGLQTQTIAVPIEGKTTVEEVLKYLYDSIKTISDTGTIELKKDIVQALAPETSVSAASSKVAFTGTKTDVFSKVSSSEVVSTNTVFGKDTTASRAVLGSTIQVAKAGAKVTINGFTQQRSVLSNSRVDGENLILDAINTEAVEITPAVGGTEITTYNFEEVAVPVIQSNDTVTASQVNVANETAITQLGTATAEGQVITINKQTTNVLSDKTTLGRVA